MADSTASIRRRSRALAGCALVAAGFVLTACGDAADRPLVPGSVPRPDFDGISALALADTQVAFGPRVPGTAGHAAQRTWMMEFLTPLADELVRDDFTHVHTETGDTIRMTNLMARFRPDARDRLLFLAHWDTRPTADAADTPELRARPIPGANDGASGTAVLMQIARTIAAVPPQIGVDLLFVDGEDYGPGVDDMLLGARRYARTVPTDDRPRYGVLLDMVGDGTPRFPIEGYSARFASEQAERIWDLAAAMGYGAYFPRTVGTSLMDDHVPLNQVGIRTVNVIDYDYGPDNAWWHTPDDDIDKLDATTLDMVGELLLELAYLGG